MGVTQVISYVGCPGLSNRGASWRPGRGGGLGNYLDVLLVAMFCSWQCAYSDGCLGNGCCGNQKLNVRHLYYHHLILFYFYFIPSFKTFFEHLLNTRHCFKHRNIKTNNKESLP